MPDRDLDRLLETFADLTERTPRWAITTRREWLARRFLFFGMTCLVILAVGGLAFAYTSWLGPFWSRDAKTSIGTSSATPASRERLLTHRLAEDSLRQSTGITGVQVESQDGCMTVGWPGGRQWIAIWPIGWSLDTGHLPNLIRDASGSQITAIGDVFSLQGASVPISEIESVRQHVIGDIPESCPHVDLLLVDPAVRALPIDVAEWRISEVNRPNSSSTTLQIEIHEIQCSSASDPRGRTMAPEIEYGSAEIVITLKVQTIGGRCPGNPFFPMAVALTEPIGDRILRDGSDGSIRWQPGLPEPSASTGASPSYPPADLVGRLIGTELVGPCSFVIAEGELWIVAWPEGYVVRDHDDPVLTNPSGYVEATQGDTIGLRGRRTDQTSLLCMTGRVFEAAEVVFVDRLTEDSLPYERARLTALGDPRLVDYLVSHPYESVQTAAYAHDVEGGASAPAILVTLRFSSFADDLPLGGCDIDREVDRPVGLAWLIDASGVEILAVSPIWDDDVRCI